MCSFNRARLWTYPRIKDTRMNILDIIFSIILCFLGIRGIFRGLVKEAASVFGLVLGFFLANSYYGQLRIL